MFYGLSPQEFCDALSPWVPKTQVEADAQPRFGVDRRMLGDEPMPLSADMLRKIEEAAIRARARPVAHLYREQDVSSFNLVMTTLPDWRTIGLTAPRPSGVR